MLISKKKMKRGADIPGGDATGDLGRAPVKKKQRRVRIPKTSSSHRVHGMPLSIWKLLIFPHLDAVELVMIQRVCKTFAGYPDLKRWIKARCQAAFGKLHKRHWNQVGNYRMKKGGTAGDVYQAIGQLPFVFTYPTGTSHFPKTYKLGVFSSRGRLVEHLYAHLAKSKRRRVRHTSDSLDLVQYVVPSNDVQNSQWHSSAFPQWYYSAELWRGMNPMDIYAYLDRCPYPALLARLVMEKELETYATILEQ